MNQTTAPNYKWIVLSNTTLGVLIATINSSILLIALPDIFRGLDIDPLAPGNSSYLLWLIMGYLVVTAVLVVSFGRLGDMYGRVRMYNAGFAIFTVFSVLLAATWMTGTPGVLWLIVLRTQGSVPMRPVTVPNRARTQAGGDRARSVAARVRVLAVSPRPFSVSGCCRT